MAASFIRDARPDELEQAARILHDAFFDSREHRYFAGATLEKQGSLLCEKKEVTSRLRFYLSNVRATKLLNGKVRLAVDERDGIMGVLLWLPPHKRIDMSPILLYRAGFGRVFYDWGWRGYQRIVENWEDKVEMETRKIITSKEELDCGLLHMIAVNSKHQGRGVGTLLLQDLANNVEKITPTMLYCANVKNRDFYAKHGYVERGRWRMLSGVVSEDGWPSKSSESVQVEADKETSYLMIKLGNVEG